MRDLPTTPLLAIVFIGTSTRTVVVYDNDVSHISSDEEDAGLPGIGRCELFAGPRRITALAVCGHKEIRKAKKGKRKVR